MYGDPDKTIAERFMEMDQQRRGQLDRGRVNAQLTIPRLLPPEDWSEDISLPNPYSSVASKGVTNLASRMLSALIPLNDLPFFGLSLKDGVEPDPKAQLMLDALAGQIYSKLSSKNIRDSFFQALQSLIVVGDSCIKLMDDYTFRSIRLDHYAVMRDVVGELIELVHIEFIPDDMADIPSQSNTIYGSGLWERPGFKTIYCRYVLLDDGTWKAEKEDSEGNMIEDGIYEVFPYAVLRWSSVTSENYGRSKVEEIFGDIQTLEAYTQSLIDSMAAASTFFMGVSPTGVTELNDLAAAQNGQWVAARREDTYVITPAETMAPQIQQMQSAVATMRQSVSEAFLMQGGVTRQAERVTATEVRMQGQELENVLGGAFSAIARDLLVPVVQRTIYNMVSDGTLDAALEEEFFEDGRISLEIITGLQALSQDSQLQKLMQMGEMMRNLPPEAIEHFKWEEYGKALISSLGFDSRNWIRSKEDLDAEKAKMMEEQQAMATQGAVGQGVAQGLGTGAAQAAGQAVSAMAPQVMEQVMTGGGAPVQGGGMPPGGM
tara:strand:+ start:19505 stop:21142 length:1638 start_codon:yes stop_codon:yes gene_type:complete